MPSTIGLVPQNDLSFVLPAASMIWSFFASSARDATRPIPIVPIAIAAAASAERDVIRGVNSSRIGDFLLLFSSTGGGLVILFFVFCRKFLWSADAAGHAMHDRAPFDHLDVSAQLPLISSWFCRGVVARAPAEAPCQSR